jgi:hypothetical protein
MPFTLSHAAAVLPALRHDGPQGPRGRGPLIATALVAGSFAPDVPYFAASLVPNVHGYGEFTHSLPGVAVADPLIAAGLAGCWLFVRDPLLALLPERARGRAGTLLGGERRAEWSARGAGWFWVSAAAGAATHVAWDAFTHPGRWGVRLLPVLDHEVHGAALHKYAQYGSSAVGLVVIGLWTARVTRNVRWERSGWRGPRLSGRARRLVAGGLGAVTAAGAALRCLRWYDLHGTADPDGFVPSAAFGAGAGLAGGVLLYAAAARLGGGRRRGRWVTEGQWAADSQSRPTPTETSSGARSG